jgi:hypothetical protein
LKPQKQEQRLAAAATTTENAKSRKVKNRSMDTGEHNSNHQPVRTQRVAMTTVALTIAERHLSHSTSMATDVLETHGGGGGGGGGTAR